MERIEEWRGQRALRPDDEIGRGRLDPCGGDLERRTVVVGPDGHLRHGQLRGIHRLLRGAEIFAVDASRRAVGFVEGFLRRGARLELLPLRHVLLHQHHTHGNRVAGRPRKPQRAVAEVQQHERTGDPEVRMRPHARGAHLLAEAQHVVVKDARGEHGKKRQARDAHDVRRLDEHHVLVQGHAEAIPAEPREDHPAQPLTRDPCACGQTRRTKRLQRGTEEPARVTCGGHAIATDARPADGGRKGGPHSKVQRKIQPQPEHRGGAHDFRPHSGP